MFPPPVRQPDVPYTCFFLAMRMSRKFRKLQLEPMAVLGEILSRGLTQHRDVTRCFAQLERAVRGRHQLEYSTRGAFASYDQKLWMTTRQQSDREHLRRCVYAMRKAGPVVRDTFLAHAPETVGAKHYSNSRNFDDVFAVGKALHQELSAKGMFKPEPKIKKVAAVTATAIAA